MWRGGSVRRHVDGAQGYMCSRRRCSKALHTGRLWMLWLCTLWKRLAHSKSLYWIKVDNCGLISDYFVDFVVDYLSIPCSSDIRLIRVVCIPAGVRETLLFHPVSLLCSMCLSSSPTCHVYFIPFHSGTFEMCFAFVLSPCATAYFPLSVPCVCFSCV